MLFGPGKVLAMLTVATLSGLGLGQAPADPSWRIGSLIGSVRHPANINYLSAASPTDAWATGSICGNSCRGAARAVLLENWNGHSWRRIYVPARFRPDVTPPTVSSFAASSADDMWIFNLDPQDALHFDGRRWRLSPLPAAITMSADFGPRDVWGLSRYAFAIHYNGRTWQRLQLPAAAVPGTLSALSPGNIWVMGLYRRTPRSPARYAAMHWNGRTWHIMPVRLAGLSPASGVRLDQAAASRPASLWVTGARGNSPFLLHWSGTTRRWTKTAIPSANGGTYCAAADGHGGVWLDTFSLTANETVFYHYNGKAWLVQKIPAPKGTVSIVNTMTRIPGTSSAWAAGSAGPQGVILKVGR